ncbi:A24 family peptidase [Jeotgalibaca porci]|uniref:prepilin peptidase n=1 Tax=Jeotgalibaca porci TaxID=1868793 RepID=UPI0016A6C5A8|nr:prepilin peptidase [Lactobacillales bacterium]
MIHIYVFGAGSLLGLLLYRMSAGKKELTKPISYIYPCLGGLMTVATFQNATPAKLLLHALLYSTLFLMAVIDHHHMLIPDYLQVILLAVAFWDADALRSVSGALLLLAVTFISEKLVKDGIGGGDVKLLIIMGFYLGPTRTSLILMLASSLALFVLLLNKKNKQDPIPFGPYLIIAFFVVKELFPF